MQCLARRAYIFVTIAATTGSKWRPALVVQLYRVVALSSATKATLHRSIDILSERGRLSGPFPSARCSVYCFRERSHLPLSSAHSRWPSVSENDKKKKEKTDGWIFQRTVTPDYLGQVIIVVYTFCCCTR